jgi:hypothetical protein
MRSFGLRYFVTGVFLQFPVCRRRHPGVDVACGSALGEWEQAYFLLQ